MLNVNFLGKIHLRFSKKAKEKERIAKEKAAEKAKADKEKAKAKEKERQAKALAAEKAKAKAAAEKAKEKAGSDEYGLLENADKNAKKVIKSMFKNVADGKDVVVTFQN